MRVRIIKHLPRVLDGVNLERFERDGVYEVTGAALDLLMVSGYAVEEAEPAATIRKEAIKVFADARIAPEHLSTDALQIDVRQPADPPPPPGRARRRAAAPKRPTARPKKRR